MAKNRVTKKETQRATMKIPYKNADDEDDDDVVF